MGLINPTLPTVGQPNSTEDVDVLNALTTIRNVINGGLDSANLAAAAGITADQLAAAVAAAAGLSQSGAVRRGKSVIATEESRTNTAFGLLGTPDRVQNLVLPTDGLIVVSAHMLARSSVSDAGRVAIFIGANQLKAYDTAGNQTGQEETIQGTANTNVVAGPMGMFASGYGALADPVTTGLAMVAAWPFAGGAQFGGACFIWAAAGTYDVSVQWRATSGSVTARQRKLWAWTVGF